MARRGYGSRWDDYDYTDWDYDPAEEEERERREYAAEKERLQSLTPENLGKEWRRHCNRHDSAVDRCEEINSPTIEDAAGWMKFIEREFEARGLVYHDYVRDDEDAAE